MSVSDTSNAIELSGVNVFRLGKRILEDVNLTVQKQACCAVIGPNGAGKSALMSIFSGYTWPTSGQVRINGHVLTSEHMSTLFDCRIHVMRDHGRFVASVV